MPVALPGLRAAAQPAVRTFSAESSRRSGARRAGREPQPRQHTRAGTIGTFGINSPKDACRAGEGGGGQLLPPLPPLRQLALSACTLAAVAGVAGIVPGSALAARAEPQNPAEPVTEVAGLLGFNDSDGGDEADPVEPFTLYGSVVKKYVIEVLQGEKILSRKRGFTVTTCTSTIAASAESPAFNSLPIGERVFNGGKEAMCIKRESKELETACQQACSKACELQIEDYNKTVTEATEKNKDKLTKAGTRKCNYECVKQGNSSTFVIPARNFVR